MTGIKLPHDWYPDSLPPGVSLGARSWLYSSFAFIHCRSTRPAPVRIGADSGVYYTSFFDLGPSGQVEIGDFCSVVGAVFATNGRVEVHDYAFLAHDVTIADSAWSTPPRSATPARAKAPAIIVGPNAWIGARAVLLAGAVIGANAIVGAGAVVDGPVPDDAVVVGNPARIVRSGSVAQASRRGTWATTDAGLPATIE